MINLHHNGAWFTFNKFNIHREASIGCFKHLSTSVTLQNHTKLCIDTHFRHIKLEPEKIKTLTTTDNSHNHYSSFTNNDKRQYTNHDDGHDK